MRRQASGPATTSSGSSTPNHSTQAGDLARASPYAPGVPGVVSGGSGDSGVPYELQMNERKMTLA